MLKSNVRGHAALLDSLPFWHFDDDFMVYADGSLGAGFRLKGIDITAASIGTVNELSTALENLINTAEEGLRLQVFYRLTPHVKDVLNQHEILTCHNDDEYSGIARSRVDFFQENAKTETYFQPEVYFFVRSLPHSFRKQRFFENDSDFRAITESQYNDHKARFLRNVKQIESSLSHARLGAKKLSQEEWFALLYQYLNLSRSEKMDCPKIRAFDGNNLFVPALSEQLTLTDLEVHRDHIRIGDYLIRVLTLKTLPEGQSQASMVEAFLKLPFYFWLSQSIHVHDQKKEVGKLQIQRRLAHSMASGAGNVSDLESESKLGHIESLIQEFLEGSEKIVSTNLSCIVWAKEINELEEKSDEVLKAFRHLNQSEGIVETLPCFDAFMKVIPGACTGLRYKKVKTSNAAHLMPVYSSWQGNKRPVCLLPNRDGALVSIDLFARELSAWNGIIFGGTGSGKSFSVLQLVLMFYGQKPRPKIVWLDNGASSQRAIEVLGGEFIDLNIYSNIRINAFDLEPGETKPTPTKVKLILAVLESILKDDEKQGLPKREKALLEEAIFRCYAQVQGRVPYLSDLRDVLKAHPVVQLRDYADILYSWTGETAYGRLLDGPTNVKFTKNLTTLETKNLSNYPELENAMLLLLTDFIRTEAARDISQPFLFIIDEGWRIFQSSKSGLAFALEAYRTFRKFNAGIWCISQNYKDFLFNEEISAAILPNTTSIFVLRQRGIDFEDFKKTLGLNETELAAVQSLQVVKGEYTEVFYMQEEGRAVFRIVPDPLSYWICTSDPLDKAKIENIERENPNLSKLDVLRKIVSGNDDKQAEAA